MNTTASRQALCRGLIDEARRLYCRASFIRDINRSIPGEAHNFGAAFAAIADATMALNIAEALSRTVPRRAR